MSVIIDSPKGLFNLSSDSGINAVVVFRDGELAVMPRTGRVSVEPSSGDSFSMVDTGSAFVSSQLNNAEVVDVLEGGSGIILAILAAAAVIAGILLARDGSENTPTSP